jgi:hypothetical protein
MVISILPAITAESDTQNKANEITIDEFRTIDIFDPDEDKYRPNREFFIPDGDGSFGASFADPIIFDNGPPVGLGSSSQYDFSGMADDFEFEDPMLVTDVHWWGVIWNPPQAWNPGDFNIYIYEDDGTGQPTGAGMQFPEVTAIAEWHPTVMGIDLGGFNYEYHYDLDPPFAASANTRYWIEIQADLVYPPQWGWILTSGIWGHACRMGFDPLVQYPYWTLIREDDAAFYLTGIPGGDDDDDVEPCLEDVCDF